MKKETKRKIEISISVLTLFATIFISFFSFSISKEQMAMEESLEDVKISLNKKMHEDNMSIDVLEFLSNHYINKEISEKRKIIDLIETTSIRDYSLLVDFLYSDIQKEYNIAMDENMNVDIENLKKTLEKLSNDIKKYSIKEKEKQAFNYIIEGNIKLAKKLLTDIYNKYPTYHNVSEVLNLLNDIEVETIDSNNKKFIDLINNILIKYSWGLEEDTINKMKNIIN